MTIIISKNGKNAKKIEKMQIKREDYLQKYIYENPDSIPLYEIKEGIRICVLAREVPTNSGFIDALGLDSDGDIYIIETKLYKNPDKRLVVAQVLDYGAALWKSSTNMESFIDFLEKEVNKNSGVSLTQKLKEFFQLTDDDLSILLENVERNLNDGNFKFVILMDKTHPQLKDLIYFINQNSQFDIYAVELEYYKYEEYEILIPRLFGAEIKKDIKVKSRGIKWNWASFSQQLKEKFGDEVVKVAQAIIDFANQNNIKVYWTSSQRGSFILGFPSSEKEFYPFAIQGDGKIGWNAPHQGDLAPPPFNDPGKRKEILLRMGSIKGAKIITDKVNGYSAIDLPIKSLSDEKMLNEFFGVLLWIKQTLERESNSFNKK